MRALNSRTALATAPGGQTIQYKVLLLANEGDATPITGATSNVTEDSVTHELSYTIKYTGTDTTAVRYWLRAVTYYMNGTDEVIILSSLDTQLETAVDLKGGVFTKDLELRPATSGYGYQTGGYNAGVLPGNYFRGDIYGVTEDGDPTSGEAVLKLSGGSISTKVRDDITIEIDRTAFLTTETSKEITCTVTRDKGITDKETDITLANDSMNNSLITYNYTLQNHGDNLSDTYYPQNPTNHQCAAEGGSASSSNIDWSNKGFYYSAFTASEDTTDKIFLLSKKEATTLAYGFDGYNAADNAKQREVTDYAKANYAYVNSGKGSWWLRSPSFPQWTAQYVRYNGNPEKVNYNDDGNVDLGMHGIVPSMCF